MNIDYSIPIIYSKNLNTDHYQKIIPSKFKIPSLIQRFAEVYFNLSAFCYKINKIEAYGKMNLSLERQSQQWYITLLKIISSILTLGLLPLFMWKIKNQHRNQYQKYFSLPQYDHSPFKKLPSEILVQILMMAITPSQPLAYVDKACDRAIKKHPWQKLFNSMTAIDYGNASEEERIETEKRQQKELLEFTRRIKKLYTNGREPSFQEKVWYLCLEMWQDIVQVPELRAIIQQERLDMAHLIGPQYQRFKKLLQPKKDAGLISMAKILAERKPFNTSLTFLLDNPSFKKANPTAQANLIRNWLDTTPSPFIYATEIYLNNELVLLSTEIIAYLKRMPNLEYLFLEENNLVLLPSAIGSLERLKTLNLSYNQLSTLPKTITRLVRLKELDLTSNELITLPDSISNFKRLQELLLFDNKLSTLPESIGNLKQMHTLDLNLNPITTLPLTMTKLDKLKKLYLDSKTKQFVANNPDFKILDLFQS